MRAFRFFPAQALLVSFIVVFTQSACGLRHALTAPLGSTSATFYSVGAQDGWILESSETSTRGGTMNAAGAYLIAGDDAQDKQYRSILSFDTRTLPDNAVVTQVVLKTRPAGLVGVNPFTTHGRLVADVRKGPFSGVTALQLQDFQAFACKNTAITIAKVLSSNWYSGAMAAANYSCINSTGITQFRLRFAKGDNDDLGADYLRFYSGNAESSYRPRLIITYHMPDTIAPAVIGDLSAVSGTEPGSVLLSWTAPGDDGNTGTATSYEVRQAASAIVDETSWSAATSATGNVPAPPKAAGGLETMTVTGLKPGTMYYFAVRASDEIPNRGGVSIHSPSAVAHIACGQVITEDTLLAEDLICPAGTESALVIGASDITLDLGGHVISGHAPGTGVFSIGQEGITIRNGTIEGFNAGVFIMNTRLVSLEDLTVRNLDISDPSHFIFGIQILGSQSVIVRDSFFEFLTAPHKEAVEIYDSIVDVDNIEVRSGGAGVSFSFAGGACDPVNSPSNGTVRNSRFSNIYVAGIWISCSSSALVEGNDFSGCPDCLLGIQGDAPFLGAVSGFTLKNNVIHGTSLGVEFRGITESSIMDNYVYDNRGWGIAMRQSLGCIAPEPGWECVYSTANVIADNETWGNVTDLYHYEGSLGNTWEGNTCETKDGIEIPECTPPHATLTINYASGNPGSFFTLSGANFPPDDIATIMVNTSVLGTVPTDPAGHLIFLLSTEQADPGDYIVTATADASSSTRFVLDLSRPLRPQEGQGTIFNVPGGIGAAVIY